VSGPGRPSTEAGAASAPRTRTLAYYPGCSLHGTSAEFDASFKATARALDLVLQEIPGWECCGNTAAHSINRLLSTALPVNELAKVEQDMKLDAVAVPCAACYSRFKTGAHEVAESAETAADVRAVVGRAYEGGVDVDNLIDVYHDAVGLDELAAKVVRPFDGLKVACYYGCLLTRPPKVTLADDPEYPMHMDEVVKAVGCEPVQWNYKTDCCGASLALTEQSIVDDLVGRILTDAKACGAEAVVVACPLCQTNLDGRQVEIAKKDPSWRGIPVIYLSQLVGRALGIDDKTLGLKKHLVDIEAVMS
jgi:heterodisulfide reductase subunit B